MDLWFCITTNYRGPPEGLYWIHTKGNKQMTAFLTKAQRSILIDWYIESLIETESSFFNDSEESERQQLSSMNNSHLYEYVQEMMPNCMQDLAKMKV